MKQNHKSRYFDQKVVPIKTVEQCFQDEVDKNLKQFEAEISERNIDVDCLSSEEAKWLWQRYSELHRAMLFNVVNIVLAIPSLDDTGRIEMIKLWQEIIGSAIAQVKQRAENAVAK